MSDLISRAEAIEAVRYAEHRFTVADEQHGMGTVKWDMYGVYTAEAVEAIKALPSADAVQIPIKLEKRYPESKDEDITDAFMRGYPAGRSSSDAVHGEWHRRIVDNGYNADWVCSECGYRATYNHYNFCPNCGARMKGGDTE